jgi:hypothetical protein
MESDRGTKILIKRAKSPRKKQIINLFRGFANQVSHSFARLVPVIAIVLRA